MLAARSDLSICNLDAVGPVSQSGAKYSVQVIVFHLIFITRSRIRSMKTGFGEQFLLKSPFK